MPSPSTSELPRPKSWDEFEDIVWELYARKWQDSHAQRYGRHGQSQNGIDIYGQLKGSDSYIAIQCKRYEDNTLTVAKVEKEITKAASFSSTISEYIIATTTSRDKVIQDFVREINKLRNQDNQFLVRIMFWEDLCAMLTEPTNRDLLVKYYSEWQRVFNSVYPISETNLADSFYDIPAPRTNFFKGREKEIKELSQALDNQIIAVVGGIPGIGKTYLVAHLIENADDNSRYIWIDCEMFPSERFLLQLAFIFQSRYQDESLLSSLRGLSSETRLALQQAAVLLEKYSCILILDNYHVFNKSEYIIEFLNNCGKTIKSGRVIIITRKWDLSENLSVYPYIVSAIDPQSGISLMKDLGIGGFSDNLLLSAYQRVEGHPKLITLLVALSKFYPLETLLTQLPFIPEKIYAYLYENIIKLIPSESRELLLNLAIFDVPFKLEAIPFLGGESGFQSLETLQSWFLVNRLDPTSDYYHLHDLEREAITRGVSSERITFGHKQIYDYYSQLQHGGYLDAKRRTFHAIHADLWERAEEATHQLLGASLSFGLYDYVLEDTAWITEFNEAKQWLFVYISRGFVARIKEELNLSIDAYQTALNLAKSPADQEMIKFELASVIIKASDGGIIEDIGYAKQFYEELQHSSDPEIMIQAMSSLASLEYRSGNRKSIRMLKDIHKLATQKKLIHKVPFIPYELARAIAHFNQNFNQVTEYVRESIAIQKSLGFGWNRNPEPWYYAHSLLGNLLMQQYKFEEAISALQICVELDKALSIKSRLAHSLNLLAKANFGNKSYDEAGRFFAESQIIVDQVRTDKELQLDNLKWFVITTWYKGNYKDALYMQIEYVNHFLKYGRDPE